MVQECPCASLRPLSPFSIRMLDKIQTRRGTRLFHFSALWCGVANLWLGDVTESFKPEELEGGSAETKAILFLGRSSDDALGYKRRAQKAFTRSWFGRMRAKMSFGLCKAAE